MKYIILLLALAMVFNGAKVLFKMIMSDNYNFEKNIKDFNDKHEDKNLVFNVLNVSVLILIIINIIIYFIAMIYVGNILFVLAGMFLVIRSFLNYNHICNYIRAIINNTPTYKYKKQTLMSFFTNIIHLGYSSYLLCFVIINWK